MKLNVLLAIVFTGLISPARAQSEEEEVMKVIVHLFDGMRQADTSAIRALFLPGAVMQTISEENEGSFGEIRNQDINALIKAIGKEIPGTFDERIMFDMVRVDGHLASVWTPYLFNYNGSLNHCGVNSFQLVKTRKGWMINYLADTRRTGKCGPSHLYK